MARAAQDLHEINPRTEAENLGKLGLEEGKRSMKGHRGLLNRRVLWNWTGIFLYLTAEMKGTRKGRTWTAFVV